MGELFQQVQPSTESSVSAIVEKEELTVFPKVNQI
jgi:hypothetical protein